MINLPTYHAIHEVGTRAIRCSIPGRDIPDGEIFNSSPPEGPKNLVYAYSPSSKTYLDKNGKHVELIKVENTNINFSFESSLRNSLVEFFKPHNPAKMLSEILSKFISETSFDPIMLEGGKKEVIGFEEVPLEVKLTRKESEATEHFFQLKAVSIKSDITSPIVIDASTAWTLSLCVQLTKEEDFPVDLTPKN